MTCTFTPTVDLTADITELTVTVKIKDELWAGTDDSIYISFNDEAKVDFLCKAPRVGQTIKVNVDLPGIFGHSRVPLRQLKHVVLYQEPRFHPLASDNWELESLMLKANGIFTNVSLNKVDQWVGTQSNYLSKIWTGYINQAAWSNSDDRPIDLNAQTYPVRWMPYLADLKSWRTYDPSTIDGVGQLVGWVDGHIVGTLLKTRQSEILEPNALHDSYTWVYTPEGSIIYRRWNHAAPADYTRHSQLGGGKPVICAGEFLIDKTHDGHSITDIITMVNDASGHYQPVGSNCLKYVAEKFEALGLDMSQTNWTWKSEAS
jgi:hypothetical protein